MVIGDLAAFVYIRERRVVGNIVDLGNGYRRGGGCDDSLFGEGSG